MFQRNPAKRSPIQNHSARVFSTAAIAAALLLAVSGCSRVPQVVDDEAVFGEVDALFTAVTSKRPQLLAECRTRLTKLHADERLSDEGFDSLRDLIETCEEGEWDTAAQRLYDFMRAQRKSG